MISNDRGKDSQGLRLFARELLERGKSRKDVARALADSGVEPDEVEKILGSVRFHDDSAFMARFYTLARKTAVANIIIGGLMLVFGTLVS